MRRLVLTLGLALSACVPLEAPREMPSTPPPVAVAPPPPLPIPPAHDSCHSEELSYLVGRHKTEIPIPIDPSNRRVTCTTCPMTMDYSPQRVNILFDQPTGIIKEVKCG